MSSAQWTQVADGNSAQWSKNKVLSDLQAGATTYNAPTVTYSSPTTYYNGYNPTTTTPEGENGASWSSATNGSASAWAKVSE